MSAQPNQKTALDQNQDRRSEPPNLDRRYGKIGIAAVAAAVQFWSAAKKPTLGQKNVRIDDRFIELAA
jgi:hypothetical protein